MRKRIFIAALAIMTAAFSATAQVKIGPKAGLAASWLMGTNLDPYDKVLPHNSFYAGVFAECEFAENFFGQAEVLYVGKGHSDRNYLGGFQEAWNTRYNLELGYVQIPVYAGYKFLDGQVSLMAGPEFGLNVLAKTTKTFNKQIYGENANQIKENVKDRVRPFNIGLGLQVSYEFLDGLGIDAKLSWGLNYSFRKGMNASGNIPDGGIDKGRNTTIQIGLFYKFEL